MAEPVVRPHPLESRVSYAMHYSRSHEAVIRVYDDAGNVNEMHEQAGEFREFQQRPSVERAIVCLGELAALLL